MKSVLLFLGTVAAALMLLAPAKAGDCRHASANFAVRASYGHSALFSTYYAPSVQLRAVGDCYAPVPVDPVPVPVPLPPLALSAGDVYGSAYGSYGVTGNRFFLRDTATYNYGQIGNARRVQIIQRDVIVNRNARAATAGTGAVGIVRAVVGTARNIVGAVIGR